MSAVRFACAALLLQPPIAIAIVCAAGTMLAGCGPTAPPAVSYLIEAPTGASNAVEPLLGRPVIEVKPVLLPDYLDTSDILVRKSGNVVAPSPNARWGERLSVGVIRGLAGGLRRLLPDYVIATTAPERLGCQVFVDVESFERSEGAPVALVARWRVIGPRTGKLLASERVSFAEPLAGTGEAETVAAMSRAVQRLAVRIATGIRRVRPACDVGSRE